MGEGRGVKRMLGWVLLLAGSLAVGCARQVPEEVNDVNRRLSQAKDDCAGVYAADALAGVQSKADAMNSLADEKKYKKARKSAEPLLPEVQSLQSAAADSRTQAKSAAEAAVQQLAGAVDAARAEDAGQYAATEFGKAEAALAAARGKLSDPCSYMEATKLAEDAMATARQARDGAVAEKKRLEEERRLAEERKKREEEEARRRAEEELRRRYPPTYTVAAGDSLWRISAMETIYGHGSYWPILHDANGDAIENPDLIFPGQQLTIPRGMDASAMDAQLADLWRRYRAED